MAFRLGFWKGKTGIQWEKNGNGRKGCGGCTQPWACRHVEVVEIGKRVEVSIWKMVTVSLVTCMTDEYKGKLGH